MLALYSSTHCMHLSPRAPTVPHPPALTQIGQSMFLFNCWSITCIPYFGSEVQPRDLCQAPTVTNGVLGSLVDRSRTVDQDGHCGTWTGGAGVGTQRQPKCIPGSQWLRQCVVQPFWISLVDELGQLIV